MHQALDGVGQLDEHPEVGDAHDDARVGLAHVLLGPTRVIVAREVPLGLFGHAFTLAGVLRQRGEVGLHALLERRREAVLQERAHHAVHHEVGVAADGAREVEVALEGEAVMTQVLARVARLLEAPEQERVHELRLRFAGGLLEDGLKVLRLRVLEVENVTQPGKGLLQRLDLLGAGVLVDAEEGRHVAPAELARHQAVGQQHHLLHQLPGRVAPHRVHVKRALVVDLDAGLGEVEVERPGTDACGAQFLREVEHDLDVALELALARGQATAVGELLHLPVRQARVGLDDGLLELERLHLACARYVHEQRKGQARLALVEGTDAVGEVLRQHRQHASREVDGRGALHGFLVEARALGHVVADVGDVDAYSQQAVPGRIEPLDAEGVVEVLGVLAVDGERDRLAVVGAARHHLGRHLVGYGLGLGQRGGVELGLEVVLDDHGASLDLGVVLGA